MAISVFIVAFFGITTALPHALAAPLNEHCNDTVMCVQKPKVYDSFQKNIDENIFKNWGIINKTRDSTPLEELEELSVGDDENCRAITKYEKPFVIKTNTTAEYVVQSKLFVQKIRVTRCKNLSSSCFGTAKYQAIDTITATCEQKSGAVSLYIYDPKQDKIRYMMFEVPICCSCKLKQSSK